ncbi:MAG: hypothetical protein ABW278_15690 [Steroidobacteraceae bacterium]
MWLSSLRSTVFALCLVPLLPPVSAAATVNGTVRDPAGSPVSGATVLVYSAGVRKGYSTFCPTCYVDCGKRATTDAQGGFSIGDLDEDLVFNLIVFQEGKLPTWLRGTDPQENTPLSAVLKARPQASDAATRTRGRVIDTSRNGVPFALVEVVGLQMGTTTSYGGDPEGLAVTDAAGHFELGELRPRIPGQVVSAVLLEVKPRGMAPALHSMQLGATSAELLAREGATVHGRLLSKGKPVANAQLTMLTLNRAAGDTFSPIYIGTDAKGRFSITNVPAGRVWSLDATADSSSASGVVETRYVATRNDGEVVDAGDLELRPGHSVSGRVILSDGKVLAPGMRIELFTTTGGSRSSVLAPDGTFMLHGLRGPYEVSPSVRGYRLQGQRVREVLVDRDIPDLVLTLDPNPPALPGR